MIKKIIVSIALIFSMIGCATLGCDLLCDGDELCYSLCRGMNDAFEEDFE